MKKYMYIIENKIPIIRLINLSKDIIGELENRSIKIFKLKLREIKSKKYRKLAVYETMQKIFNNLSLESQE